MSIDQKKVKQKKEKKEGETTKERKKSPWKAKQLMRVDRAMKSLTKLSGVLAAAKAPGVDPALAQNALVATATLMTQVNMIAGDWKPAKGSAPGSKTKVGVGSHIQIKAGLEGDDAKVYKHIPTNTFINAAVIDEDTPRTWVVLCTDNIKRIVRKKHAVLYVAPVAAEVPATAAA